MLQDIFGNDAVDIYTIPVEYKTVFQAGWCFLHGLLFGVTSAHIEKIKAMVMDEQYRLVFLNTSYFGSIAKALRLCFPTCKIITFFHNVELVFFDALVKKASFIKKIWYFFRRKVVIKTEAAAVRFSTGTIVLNQRDGLEMRRIYGRQADLILPLTFKDAYNPVLASQYAALNAEPMLLFVGPAVPFNVNGICWFIENCLQKIPARLVVIGKGMEQYADKYAGMRVSFVGYVEDLAAYYYQADAVVLPVFEGSGMKTKTCEALMYGKAVFGTAEAFEGYDAAEPESHGWLCNAAETFVANINAYLPERKKLNETARAIFQQHYSTENHVHRLAAFLTQ